MSPFERAFRPPGWVLALCLVGATHALAATDSGSVRVADWALTQGLKPAWTKPDETLVLTGPGTRIVLTMNSRVAVVNGVRVWLVHAATRQDGWVRLTKMDAQETLEPILCPTKKLPTRPVKTICIDPGHGGKDPGFHAGGREEKDFTLLLAKELQAQLLKKKFRVVLTRSTDTYVDLDARSEVARRRGADLFISLHFNSASGTTKGSETYCLTPTGAPSTNTRGDIGSAGPFPGNRNNAKNILLAYQIQSAMVNKLAVEDRGVQRSRFAVLREATMPAALVESGFMSNSAEAKKIYTSEYRRRISSAIVSGILSYKAATEPVNNSK